MGWSRDGKPRGHARRTPSGNAYRVAGGARVRFGGGSAERGICHVCDTHGTIGTSTRQEMLATAVAGNATIGPNDFIPMATVLCS